MAYPIEGVSNCVECAQEFVKDIEIAEHFGIHHGRLEKFIKKEGFEFNHIPDHLVSETNGSNAAEAKEVTDNKKTSDVIETEERENGLKDTQNDIKEKETKLLPSMNGIYGQGAGKQRSKRKKVYY